MAAQRSVTAARRLAAPAAVVLALAPAASASPRCDLGPAVGERALLRPAAGTFYAVDALNPDVVRWRGRYLMFFSGNDLHTAAGRWRTGLATAAGPLGPFRVGRGFAGDWFNGGSAVWRGQLWQARQRNHASSDLASSSDGFHWRHEIDVPAFRSAGGAYIGFDYALESTATSLTLYMLIRPPSGGLLGRIAAATWAPPRGWSALRVLLAPGSQQWENADLGEPAAFRVSKEHYLLYTGTDGQSGVRGIGVARERRGQWTPCGPGPFVAPGAAFGPAVAIDPSPLVVGRRLYVYFGGGTGTSIASDLGGAIGVRVHRLP